MDTRGRKTTTMPSGGCCVVKLMTVHGQQLYRNVHIAGSVRALFVPPAEVTVRAWEAPQGV